MWIFCPLSTRPLEKRLQNINRSLLCCPLRSGISKLEHSEKKHLHQKPTASPEKQPRELGGSGIIMTESYAHGIGIRTLHEHPKQNLFNHVQSWVDHGFLRSLTSNFLVGDLNPTCCANIARISGYSHVWVELRMNADPISWVYISEIYSTCVACNPSPLVVFRKRLRRCGRKTQLAISMSIWFFVCDFAGSTSFSEKQTAFGNAVPYHPENLDKGPRAHGMVGLGICNSAGFLQSNLTPLMVVNMGLPEYHFL